jgi:hypothetical protein
MPQSSTPTTPPGRSIRLPGCNSQRRSYGRFNGEPTSGGAAVPPSRTGNAHLFLYKSFPVTPLSFQALGDLFFLILAKRTFFNNCGEKGFYSFVVGTDEYY